MSKQPHSRAFPIPGLWECHGGAAVQDISPGNRHSAGKLAPAGLMVFAAWTLFCLKQCGKRQASEMSLGMSALQ